MFTLTIELWAPPSLSHTMNEPCLNDECNVNSWNECMRPQNKFGVAPQWNPIARQQPMYPTTSGAPTSATSTSTPLPLGLLKLPGTRDPPYT